MSDGKFPFVVDLPEVCSHHRRAQMLGTEERSYFSELIITFMGFLASGVISSMEYTSCITAYVANKADVTLTNSPHHAEERPC
jgi:hypothetical protein